MNAVPSQIDVARPAGAHVAGRRDLLRPFPYPYRAMLALCSDLDETPDAGVYLETMRFLNTTRATSMGDGVGLEVGNTIYFDMPREQFAYWNTDDRGRAMVRDMIRSGHVDCFHSFGDLATTRAHCARALEELARHDCAIRVWVDHGTAVSNFGADIMCGAGDLPGSEVYHADLTLQAGVEYVWRGRVTSVIGQDAPRRLGGIWHAAHPLASARTLLKEAAKGWLASAGNEKYALHASNDVLTAVRLRDGQAALEFLRANPHWGGVSSCETAMGLGQVLTPSMLADLEARAGAMILYTHLGKVRDPRAPLPEDARAALRRLAGFQADGRILVTTTERLLDYCRARAAVDIGLRQDAQGEHLELDTDLPLARLGGLSFVVRDAARATLTINGQPFGQLQRHAGADGGCVSIPWRRLEFPCP